MVNHSRSATFLHLLCRGNPLRILDNAFGLLGIEPEAIQILLETKLLAVTMQLCPFRKFFVVINCGLVL